MIKKHLFKITLSLFLAVLGFIGLTDGIGGKIVGAIFIFAIGLGCAWCWESLTNMIKNKAFKNIVKILLYALPIIFSVVFGNAGAGALSIIFLTIILMILMPFVKAVLIGINADKEAKRNQEIFNSLDIETKKTISQAKKNYNDVTILTPEFMDKNNILMILSYDFENYNLKKCVLKDKNTNTICLFYLLDADEIPKFEKPSLSVTELVNTNYTYNEEKLVYTSATVGFVTTGGFHKEGGDYTARRSFTGKYGITEFECLKNNDEILILNEVYLNSDLIQKAENSNIKKYIKGSSNCLHLLHGMTQHTKEILDYASSAVCGNYSQYGAYNYLKNQAKNEMALTKEECIEIKDWLLSSMN